MDFSILKYRNTVIYMEEYTYNDAYKNLKAQFINRKINLKNYVEGPGTKGVNKTSDFILLANYSNLLVLDVLRGGLTQKTLGLL